MIKRILILAAAYTLLVGAASAQWTYKQAGNPIDGQYKVAYTETASSGSWLRLFENGKGGAGLYLHHGYVCTDNPYVTLAFQTDTGWAIEVMQGMKSKDSEGIYVSFDVETDFGKLFLAARQLMIRVDDEHCGTKNTTLSMRGSTAALNFIVKP